MGQARCKDGQRRGRTERGGETEHYAALCSTAVLRCAALCSRLRVQWSSAALSTQHCAQRRAALSAALRSTVPAALCANCGRTSQPAAGWLASRVVWLWRASVWLCGCGAPPGRERENPKGKSQAQQEPGTDRPKTHPKTPKDTPKDHPHRPHGHPARQPRPRRPPHGGPTSSAHPAPPARGYLSRQRRRKAPRQPPPSPRRRHRSRQAHCAGAR